MARHARGGDLEISIYVARRAVDACMLAGQGELCLGMVKRSWRPSAGGMANRTIGRKPELFVIRVGGLVVRREMTRRAVRRCSGELPVHVTTYASGALVTARQGKLRKTVVVEGRRRPGSGGVASGAFAREAGLNMIGISGRIEVLAVAGIAIGRSPFEPSAHVTRGTREGRMHTGQRELRKSRMIKLGSQPCVERAMTVLACRGEA